MATRIKGGPDKFRAASVIIRRALVKAVKVDTYYSGRIKAEDNSHTIKGLVFFQDYSVTSRKIKRGGSSQSDPAHC